MGDHLLDIKSLSTNDILEIMMRAKRFEHIHQHNLSVKQDRSEGFIANLFFEPSTRTRFSFEVAEKRLGLQVLNLQPSISSIQKGETLYDTLKTLQSQGIKAAVIRVKEDGVLKNLSSKLQIKLINAGEGVTEHPTQALLDLYTIQKYFGNIKGLNVAIIGDVTHSRVAKSDSYLLKKMGANIIYSGPKEMMDQQLPGTYMEINEALKVADIVIMLRIQFERIEKRLPLLTNQEYNKQFGLTEERVKYLQKHAIIMHPAPVNRGIEMDDSIVEHPQSKIFEQIENGVWVRMAVIERAIGGEQNEPYYHQRKSMV